MSKYSAIWAAIKKDERVEITVSKEASRRIINGIKLAKTTENVARRQAALVGWSKLVIEKKTISDTMLKLTIRLLYSTKI